MKKCFTTVLLFLIMLIIAFSCFAQNWGTIRYVHSPANIRAERSGNSKMVGRLDVGNRIKADFLKDDWFAVFDINETIRDDYFADFGYCYDVLPRWNVR